MHSNMMLDLETLGKRPGCVVLSIGAVGFGPGGVAEDGYYGVLSTSSGLAHGLHTHPDTVAWWRRQSDEARRVLDESGVSVEPLRESLGKFDAWFAENFDPSRVKVYARGPGFDCGILSCAYGAIGLEPPWRFWNERCCRTAEDYASSFGYERSSGRSVAHHALLDARSQANEVIEQLKLLRVQF